MDANRLRNLAFLMSLGGVSCFQDDGPRTTTGAGTGGTTGTTTTDGPDPASDSSTTPLLTDSGTTTTGTTDAPATTTDTTEPTTAPPTGTTGTDGGTDVTGTTGGPPGDPVCEPYGAKIIECVPRYAEALPDIIGYCDKTIKNGTTIDGDVCRQALEEYFACLTGLACRDLFMEWDMPYTKCTDQGKAIATGCPNYEF